MLIVLDSVIDFDVNKLIEYIEEYKFIDILRMSNITKSEYRKLNKIVEEINNEYGSSIEIIQKRNIQNYDFYMLYTTNKKEYFKSHYILNKQAYILDITDIDDDILSKEYKSYTKNKGYVETIFNRMNLNMGNYSKIDIGMLYIKS